ncbi:MAG: transporter substrate-binding domain-containing protein [Anaerolineae bacterium]|nr:transporter substrate-binding domain-containing protein [Anaerolineae bacterium]
MAAAALLVVALLVFLLWRAVGPARDRYWERIQRTGEWRVAMDPSFPPFEMLDAEGRPIGFDVDLASAIAQRWGVALRVESIGFDGLLDAVWAGKVDSVVSAMPLQPQFSRDVAFSSPYFEAGLVVVLPSADNGVAGLEDLAGRRVAVEWGSEADVQARGLRRRWPDLQIVPKETAAAALEAVVAGEADAALADHVTALQFIGGGGQARLLTVPEPDGSPRLFTLVSDPYVVVMPKRAPVLQAQVEAALQALAAEGILDALTEKWFGVASPP